MKWRAKEKIGVETLLTRGRKRREEEERRRNVFQEAEISNAKYIYI